MSCGVALAISLLFADPAAAPGSSAPSATAEAPASVAAEPLFADIVSRSQGLKAVVDTWIATGAAQRDDLAAQPEFARLRESSSELADRNMEGHRQLAARNLDGDLKCILRGIAEDMPGKVDAVAAASDAAQRSLALDELAYLLNDNAEVILAPPQPPA